MELSDSNPYQNGRILNLPNGERMLLRERIAPESSRHDRIHVLRKNEELTNIAWKYYSGQVQDPQHYWWVIADANDIVNPLDLSDKERLLIPDIFNIVTDQAL